MNKKMLFFLIIGLLLIIIPFIFSSYNIFRLISVILGILIITISCIFNPNRNIYLIIILPLLLIFVTYSIDIFLYIKFSRIPIYIYEIKSNEKISTYNSFFYRIYKCDNELILDYGYEKKYACSNDSLEEITVNDFLLNAEESYNQYKNKFVKITGKISKISGREQIELGLYETVDNSLNGYVNFNNDYKLQVNLNEDLTKYRIYDYVSVIGRVTSYNNGTIILQEAYTIPSDIYNDYTYEITLNNDTNLVNITDNYYLYGISTFYVKYAEDAIYELRYLLNDGKINIEDMIDNSGGEILRDEENNIIARNYNFDDFDILVCENDKYIFTNNEFDKNINLCNYGGLNEE